MTQPASLVERILEAARVGTQLPNVEALANVDNDELRRRIFLAAEPPGGSHPLEDPVESDPHAGPTVRRVRDEVFAEVTREYGESLPRGICHLIWSLTKKRLREQHGIIWFSPADMNPGAIFD